MSYFKSTLRLILVVIVLLHLASYLPSQQKVDRGYMGYSEEDLIKMWEKWLKKFPLPKNAVELEVIQSFPSEELFEKGIYLWRPIGMEYLSNGNIVVNDQKANQILMFDDQGKFIKKIGKKGQGPGEFGNPFCLSSTSETIIVGDNSNMRIQFYDLKGNFIREFKIYKAFLDMAVSHDGLIYAAPIRIRPESSLVDVLDTDGKLLTSFGEARFGDKSDWQIPNMVGGISINDKNELFIAFMSFPLVCKYSENGDLLAEYKLEHEVMKEKEKINLDHLKKNQDGLMTVIYSIRAGTNGFSILRNYPRAEILEYDNDGRLQNEYYYEYKNRAHDTYFGDFFIKKIESKKLFYLLKKVPENEIVILRPKKISSYKERR